jgi:excinuclease ABC subunit C
MDQASQRLAFEQAAIYRDQIQSLHQVQEKQYISSSKGEDIDIIVAASGIRAALRQSGHGRGGRHLGDRPMFPTNAGDNTPADAVGAFIASTMPHTPPRESNHLTHACDGGGE